MKRILDVGVSTFLTQDGIAPGVPLSTRAGINLERMGEGVRSVVTIAAELADHHQPRLFLIEEPENDLHPEALYNLLQVLREATEYHQFVISTHSDLVLRELGSIPGSVVYLSQLRQRDGLPSTNYVPLANEFERRDALKSLGYRESLPIAWLVFEESTAESFVRECLIPLFAPRLAAIRTVSSDGAGNLPRTVEGLHRMVLFARLVEPETPRAWVLADGDDAGREAILKLRAGYKAWPETRFETFDQNAIEAYYPAHFAKQVHALDEETNKNSRRKMKAKLVTDVLAWSATDGARADLESSAAGVISHLKRIEAEILELRAVQAENEAK
jgi:hypothetical protein